ncbi:MAG TPA: hypothetical protein VEY11_17065 [Pyrinomonadaceae bacterium]|nr:hypothetical protein [Pyrinomonadaceae bacterium]
MTAVQLAEQTTAQQLRIQNRSLGGGADLQWSITETVSDCAVRPAVGEYVRDGREDFAGRSVGGQRHVQLRGTVRPEFAPGQAVRGK